ncbi:sugar transferase [Leuconostoc mesenteroides]|uniref:sugar transferase n=1 Tax=Leuconostoc mesenteroides TaxID=1245 RepID=UPI0032DF144B
MGALKKMDGIVVEKKIIVRKDKRYLLMKKIIDYIGSGLGILLLTPVLVLIAIIIKFEDGGPVIFRQERIGYNGKKFYIFKFRSMRVDAEKLKKELLDQNEVEGAMFKMKDDPRVTNFGKFLRKHSLDELPQFFNVILGDMSLVGPRPPLIDEVENYTEYDKQRLLVRPGLSGLWQISGRNNLSFDDMVQLDLQYIETRNIWLDMKIIFKTVWNMISIKRNGAF